MRIVQLWHASGPFKTVGYSRIGKEGGPRPVVEDAQELHARDRQLRGRRAVLRRGVRDPRIPRRPDRHPADGPVLRSRGTRRGSGGGAGRLPDDARPVDDPVRADVPWRRARGTPPTTRAGSTTPRSTRWPPSRTRSSSSACTRSCGRRSTSPRPYADRLIDGSTSSIDVNDLLFIVDLLVTDYSSIVFEYSTLARPMLFYTPGPGGLHRVARLLRADRDVRPGSDRPDLRGAPRRHPAPGLRDREGRPLRGAPLRASRRLVDRPRHRRGHPRAMRGR